MRPHNPRGSVIIAAGWERYAILAPLALHGYTLYQSVFCRRRIEFWRGQRGFLHRMAYRHDLLAVRLFQPPGRIANPGCAGGGGGGTAPAGFSFAAPLANTELPAFKAHISIAMLAYSLLTIAALHALLMAVVERRLHHPSMPSVLTNLPPLLTMETLLFRVIWVGFILLTLTLISGIVFSEEIFGQPLKFTHKTLFGIISWGVFAALLAGRQFYGWRGRIAIRWTLAGFIILLLAYLGSKFVLEVILQR